jgi:uncharacterized membrane protein
MQQYFFISFGILLVILWFWAFFDILKTRFKIPFLNTVWLLIVVLIPFFGSISYLIFRKKLIKKEKRKFNPSFNRVK